MNKFYQWKIFKQIGFVTLLEVIIAMALTLLVLTTLTFFYQQTYLIGENLDVIQKQSFQMRFLENRFSQVFPKAVPQTESDFVFFTIPEELGLTKSGSLIFTYDNEVDIDKAFSNHVIARLFVNPENQLTLAYWPSPDRWEGNPMPPIKKEVLLEGVDSLSFDFFIAPNKDSEPSPPPKPGEERIEPEPKGDWKHEIWPLEYRQLPAMIRMTVTTIEPKEKMVFVFPFPNTRTPITYDH